MPLHVLKSPDHPQAAAALFAERSAARPVVVFKKSPICPVSFRAEDEYQAWCDARSETDDLETVVIDVIEEKPLARGLTAELEIQHESPQLLWFEQGRVRWHGSHDAIHRQQLDELWNSRWRA